MLAVASYGNYDEILGFLFHETACLFGDGEIPTIEPLYKSHLLCCFLVLVMSLCAACLFSVDIRRHINITSHRYIVYNLPIYEALSCVEVWNCLEVC